MTDIQKTKAKELQGEYPISEISTAISIAELGDPDGAYTMFEDMGKYDLAEIVSGIYF